MTKGAFRDLQQFVNDQQGRVPVFGYPLICYSPVRKHEEGTKVLKRRVPDAEKKSKWKDISKVVINSNNN